MMKKEILTSSFIFFFIFLVTKVAKAQEQKEENVTNVVKTDRANIKKFGDMRDPFKKYRSKKVKEKINLKQQILVDGSFSNIPQLSEASLDAIKIVGILLGKKRLAIAKIFENDRLGQSSYLLREGMKIGANNSEIKAILPGGIVIVEKIPNIYGQDEYFETIIPLHTGT